jgi:hypothetical protein
MKLSELLEVAKTQLSELTSLQNPDFRLEQASLMDDGETWEIVVSYLVKNTNPRTSPLNSFSPDLEFNRIYKSLEIDQAKNVTGFYMYENQ